MPKILADKALQAFDELSRFVSRQNMVDSLEKAATDKQLLRKATTDPKGFLRAEKVKLPPRAQFKYRSNALLSLAK